MEVKTMKFNDIEVPVVPLSEDLGTCLGEAKTGKSRKNKEIVGELNQVKYEEKGAFKRLWWKPVGAVVSEENYIRVVKRRKTAILGVILIVLAIIELAVWIITGQNAAKNTYNYIGDAAGIIQPNKDVKGKVTETTAFESIPDTVNWRAGSTKQSITLKNMDGNTVELAPQVYIDTNKNGKFESSECVYNKSGKTRIQPGKTVNSITLSKSLSAGNYNGEVVYQAFAKSKNGTETQANGMTFNFKANVQ